MYKILSFTLINNMNFSLIIPHIRLNLTQEWLHSKFIIIGDYFKLVFLATEERARTLIKNDSRLIWNVIIFMNKMQTSVFKYAVTFEMLMFVLHKNKWL